MCMHTNKSFIVVSTWAASTGPPAPQLPIPDISYRSNIRLPDRISNNNALLSIILSRDSRSDLILDHCSPKSLIRLLRTSRVLREVVTKYMEKAFNIEKILARYFPNPSSFRFIQACTGTLISGSTALQFFDRSFYPESDLDIYVSKAWRVEVGQFLLQSGYQFVPHGRQRSVFENAVSEMRIMTSTALYGNFRGISGVFNFVKQGARGERLKVQLMVSARSPIEPILRYHSSKLSLVFFMFHSHDTDTLAMVMNVISFDTAYCMYPRATLEQHVSLACTARRDPTLEGIYRKYAARGWRTIRSVDSLERRTSDPALCARHPRWINDGLSWSVRLPLPSGFGDSLPPLNWRTGAIRRDPVSATSWRLAVDQESRTCETVFVQPQAVNLFYQYVFANEDVLRTMSVRSLMEFASSINVGCHSNPLYSRH